MITAVRGSQYLPNTLTGVISNVIGEFSDVGDAPFEMFLAVRSTCFLDIQHQGDVILNLLNRSSTVGASF